MEIQRIELPRPTSANDMYMFDQCLSLRLLADLVAILVPQVPIPAADAPVELREPAPKPTTRDELQAADQATAPTGPPAAAQTAPARPQPAQPAQKVETGTRRHPSTK